MARYLLTTVAAVALALIALLALGVNRDPRLATLAGNYAYARGDYVTATIHYLAADPAAARGHPPAAAAYLSYSLGTTYLALGEVAAGIELLHTVTGGSDDRLRGRVAFNLGNAHYEIGSYREAARHYREALLLAPGSIDAKINLELTLRKVHSGGTAAAAEPHHAPAAADSRTQTASILEFIRRREPPPPVNLPPQTDAAGY